MTKPPPWHGLVAWDMLFNNLTTGLFLVAALRAGARRGLRAGRALAYPLALVLSGPILYFWCSTWATPGGFHHMLRVFKPTSPMSLGIWSLTVFSLPLTVAAI